MKTPLKNKIGQAQKLLEADDKRMARALKLTFAQFQEIKGGGRVLPLPVRKTLERRLNALLDACGLEGLK